MISKIVIGLLSLCMIVVAPMAVSDHLTSHPDYTAPRSYVRLVYNDDGNGSGVMIAPNRMLTAAHVADILTETNPLFVEGKKVRKVLKIDRDRDIALLDVDADCPCAPLGDLPKIDEAIIVVGYPINKAIQVQIITTGTYQGLIADKTRLVTTAPASFGNSGGGLFLFHNGKWELIGILVAMSGQNSSVPFVGVPYNDVTFSTRIPDEYKPN